MKEYKITIESMIERADDAIACMESAITNDVGIFKNKSTQYSNYMFHCGQYHAFMQILYSMDKETWHIVMGNHIIAGKTKELAKAADELYRELRQGVEV